MKSIYERFTKRTLLSILIIHFSMLSFAATYYVSSIGNDSNSGLTTSQAWKTLAKVNATTFKAGDQVLFQKGDAFYGSITIINSGSAGNPITFGAYGTGANPIISGFTPVTAWSNLGNNIWESSNAVSTLSTCNMVAINGLNTPMGRYPNADTTNGGYLTFQSHSGNTSITSNSLTGTPNWTGAEVVVRSSQWNLERSIISSQSASTITYAPITKTPIDGFGFFIKNDVRTLDQQNEWYFEPTTKKLKVYSTSLPINVQVSSVDILAAPRGSYITFNNITFQGANKFAIFNDNSCTNINIQYCSILYTGIDAIKLIDTSYANVDNCYISDANNIGINLSAGDRYATVRSNTIRNTGIIAGMGVTGFSMCTGIVSVNVDEGIIAENNSIINTGYIGINFSGNSVLIKNNLIDTFCTLVQDGGGIYTQYETYSNRVIDGNIIINGIGNSLGTNDNSALLVHGIYVDDGGAFVTIKNNSISGIGSTGIFFNGAHDISIINNTIFNARGSGFFTGAISFQGSLSLPLKNYLIKRNTIVAKTISQFCLFFYNSNSDGNAIKQFGIADSNYYSRPIDDNDVFRIRSTTNPYPGTVFNLSTWQSFCSQDANSHKSSQTISSESDFQFEYNATSSTKTVILSRSMIDVKGTKYSNTITLQPYTSIVLMKDLTAAVVSGAPTSVVATAGNASASVTFVAPASNGGSTITGYSVTSIPAGGTDTNAGSTSLTHLITGLTNGTSYTFTVKATNSVGTSVASVASNSVIPKAPAATAFTFTGPTSGNVNSASSNYTVTPNNLYTGTITITPSGTGSAGLSTKVLTFANSSAAQTFTITPIVSGSITLTPTNNGTLTNPANLSYTVNAVVPNAPTSIVATSGDASASVTFVAPTNTGGSAITGYTVTSIPSGGIDANAGSTALTHTITGLINGTSYTFTVKATNSVGSSVASVVSNSVIPIAESIITKQGVITPTHFTTVWQGLNGLNQMNINVVSATLEDLPLSVDDEIAVFSGSACVGASKLTQSIVPSDNSTFVTILASQNDGSGNGFTDNDTIVFKIWNNKTQKELQINSVVYHSDISTWKTNGRYSPASTAVVDIASYQVYTQSIELLKGYNMISTYVSAQNPNVSVVTKTLVDQGNLIKMQDETGNSLENWGDFGGWVNKLGSLEETEGYKIQVANNCTLQVTGRYIAMPFDIALKTGWNIISFPRTDIVNAMSVVQSLIDQNKLVKVQDEAGNSIENWGLFGGWKNGIGNFIPGKAYKVKMSADAILTFQESYPKSAIVLAKSEQTEYYHSSVEGNGTDHMNINITGLNNIGISIGDELAAFDGSVCVATTKITEANLLSGSACLVSSFSTVSQNPNGFKVGDPIQISVWNKLSGGESKVNAEVITGQLKYEKNASVLVKMKSATLATGIIHLDDVVKIDVFPNPCQGRVTVRFSEIPEANSRIEISDVSGRKLISRVISGILEEFNLESFTPGLYLVKSILGKNEYVQKLIVNK